MNYAIELGKYHKKKIWLGVWEKNEKALGFYKKVWIYEDRFSLFLYGKKGTNRFYNDKNTLIKGRWEKDL